jgi:hypothetical protein
MDPITEQCLQAVSGMVAGTRDAPSGHRVPHVETKSSPVTGDGSMMVPGLPEGMMTVSTKGAGYLGSDAEPAGSALNPIAQLGLFSKIRAESSWLRFTTFAPVTENTGYLDTWDDRNFRMHSTASEGPRNNIPLHKPDVDQNTYSCRLMSGAFGIRLKALRQAVKAGQNVTALVRKGIAAGIGNVLADLGINGDTALPDDTDENKQRRVVDGWFQKIRENGGNYRGVNDGFSYHNGIWAGMLQDIEKPYRADRGLAWMLSDTLSTRWLTELTATGVSPANSHPSIINDLGSQLLNAMGAQANPLGKPGVVIPQMEDDRYSTAEGYTGVAPTSIVNNGNGTLTVNANTLADSGVDRSSTGTDGQRYITIGRVSTGVEETLAVDYAAPNNTVTTASQLGQTVVSTTAADYYIKWADTQSVFLGLPRFLTLVIQNGMRIYTVFYPHDEKFEVIVHIDLDYMVVDYEALSLTDDIITPRFSIVPA